MILLSVIRKRVSAVRVISIKVLEAVGLWVSGQVRFHNLRTNCKRNQLAPAFFVISLKQHKSLIIKIVYKFNFSNMKFTSIISFDYCSKLIFNLRMENDHECSKNTAQTRFVKSHPKFMFSLQLSSPTQSSADLRSRSHQVVIIIIVLLFLQLLWLLKKLTVGSPILSSVCTVTLMRSDR